MGAINHCTENTVYGPINIDEAGWERVKKTQEMLSKIEKDLVNKNSAIKNDQGKVPLSLLSTTALMEIAKVLEFGKEKYAADNWRKGFMWRRTLDAALRHLLAFNDGEDKDPETGLSHLAHLGCNIMFLLEFEQTHPEMDDRYKRGAYVPTKSPT
jgi:hypothetical protein